MIKALRWVLGQAISWNLLLGPIALVFVIAGTIAGEWEWTRGVTYLGVALTAWLGGNAVLSVIDEWLERVQSRQARPKDSTSVR